MIRWLYRRWILARIYFNERALRVALEDGEDALDRGQTLEYYALLEYAQTIETHLKFLNARLRRTHH